MVCQKVSPWALPDLQASSPRPSLNLNPPAKPPQFSRDYYLCDQAQDRPLLANGAVSAKPLASLYPSRIFAAPIVSAPTLPPPPDTPLAKLIYDLTTQLKDFELSADLKLPMEGIGPGQVQTFTHAVLKGQGAVVQLGIDFKPYAGPQSLLKPFEQVPIIGPFFIVKILRVQMNPSSRKLEAKVQYLWFPVSKDVHEDYVNKAELDPDLIRGKGWDLYKGLPVYSWQILDIVLKIAERRGLETAKKVGIDKVKPVLDKAEISISGDFSNEKVQLGGLALH
ncbi:MAG TPA: hypothetical protein VFW62_12945, partial [bacterium]|nr:hypothetical protein [bacterium]